DQVICSIRYEQTGHVLDAYTVSTHFLQYTGILYEQLQIVDRTYSITHRCLCMTAFFLAGFDSGLNVPRVIQSIEYPDDIDTVCYGFLNKVFDHIISVMLVSKKILPPEQHLQLSLFGFGSYLSEP